jgi:hypothetical protein
MPFRLRAQLAQRQCPRVHLQVQHLATLCDLEFCCAGTIPRRALRRDGGAHAG